MQKFGGPLEDEGARAEAQPEVEGHVETGCRAGAGFWEPGEFGIGAEVRSDRAIGADDVGEFDGEGRTGQGGSPT